MKKYTAEDFADFERNEEGYIICPSGDYRAIREFPNKCSFGKWSIFGDSCKFNNCSFADGCKFGEWCDFGGCRFNNGHVFRASCSFEDTCRFNGTMITETNIDDFLTPGRVYHSGKEKEIKSNE